MLKSMGISFSKKIYIGVMAAVVLLNLLAWKSTAFCDAYIAYVFPVWVGTYGRLTGLFPFSVGEWMIAAGVLLAVAAAVLGIVSIIRRKWYCRFFRFFAWTLLAVCLIMTLNCFILYHASAFSEKYFGRDTGEYSLEDLLKLRNYVAEQCNRLSGEVSRDEKGRILYTGSSSAAGEAPDMEDMARVSMRKLGQTYDRLDGYYPRPKALLSSDFLCQQNMLGWYFPFSMEANYNKTAYVMNRPASMCHELAHLRGYIYEDEANFISYLACVQSEDIYFQYSGYLSVLGYLEQDIRKAAKNSPEEFLAACGSEGLVKLLEIVYEDDIFVTDEDWDRINRKALINTKTVGKATDVFVDTTLKANGVSDGKISYSRVVKLLLQYYQTYGQS